MKTLILGMGPGPFGFPWLRDLLSAQNETYATLESAPMLPWSPAKGVGELIGRRIERLLRERPHKIIADIGHFYLPYVKDAVSFHPKVKCVCLCPPIDRACDLILERLRMSSRPEVNHWCGDSGATDFLLSRTFPRTNASNVNEAIKEYVQSYSDIAVTLEDALPHSFLKIDPFRCEELDAVRRLLDFCDFPPAEQVVARLTDRLPAPDAPNQPKWALGNESQLDENDASRCAVLVPHGGFIHPGCENSLRELEKRGYEVRRVSGYAAIDQGRNQMATDALVDGFDETLWIDSDIEFDPDSVEKLRNHRLPIVGGIYPQKGRRALACHVVPGTSKLTFGDGGGLIELLYAATGFLLIRRSAYQRIYTQLRLPVCNERFGRPMIPFFLPMIREVDDGEWYLAEDYAFCERARSCGLSVFADTSIRLWHIGSYSYGWEDSGISRPRFGSFTLTLSEEPI